LATPQGEIGNRCGFEGRAFAVEFVRIDRAGRGVQRHVEEQDSSASGQCATAGCGAFPIGAARFVEVQMDIDKAGEDGQSCGIDFLFASGQFSGDGGDLFAFDGNIRVDDSLGRDDAAVPDDQVIHGGRTSGQFRWRRQHRRRLRIHRGGG
jgi:hypothetical protein